MNAHAAIQPATADDIIFGIPPGRVHDRPTVVSAHASPAEALVRVSGELAGDNTCFVGFSGGCDSSLVLASCTRARREQGLPDPIAVTLRYDHPSTDERTYQEAMIAHLQLRDWVVSETRKWHDLSRAAGIEPE